MSVLARSATLFVALMAFWLVISPQRTDPLFLGLGIASALLVTAYSQRLVTETLGPFLGGLVTLPGRALRYVGYIAWLVSRIPPAAVQIAYYTLHPRMPIEPGVLRFTSHLASPSARALLANSITLVPGTLTVAVEGEEFVVHAFFPSAAEDLISGHMQARIARVFNQDPEHDPQARWVTDAEVSR